MVVLLTGNRGYIGTVATRMLRRAGFEVVGLDTGYYSDCILGDASESEAERQIAVDIRDVQPSHLAGIDAIVHLAALSNDPTGELNPGLTEAINTQATIRLAQMAKGCGVRRFVFASSCSIYGSNGKQALSEIDAMDPQTAYARSKADCEMALTALADDRFSPTYMRNGTAYGFSPRLRFDIAVNNLTGWGLATGKVTLLSDGRAWRPFVHVDDIVDAVVCVLQADLARVHNQAFNVGSEEDNWQIRDIAEEVASALPGTQVVFQEGVGSDHRNYNVSFERIRRELPTFRPRWNVRSGIRQLIDELTAGGPLTRDVFESRQYTRLKQLQYLLERNMVTDQLRWAHDV
jgi:nucleoside-diphosphate-sugar epimerase